MNPMKTLKVILMTMNNSEPNQGEIWLFDSDTPCIVISNNFMNLGPSSLIFIVPLTSVEKHIESHVKIVPPSGGLTVTSFAIPEQIRSISKQRLVKKLGKINEPGILEEIRSWIMDFINLND